MSSMDLKKQLSLQDLENTFWVIQTAIQVSSMNPVNNLSSFIIVEEPTESGIYSELVNHFDNF